MKKEYVKPEMVLEEILLEGMLALSNGGGNGDTEIGGGVGDDGPSDANSHRGSWGDLWN